MVQTIQLMDALIILSFFYVYLFLVKGRLFEVKELFLEDVLKLTGFHNKDMKKFKEETQTGMELLIISSVLS